MLDIECENAALLPTNQGEVGVAKKLLLLSPYYSPNQVASYLLGPLNALAATRAKGAQADDNDHEKQATKAPRKCHHCHQLVSNFRAHNPVCRVLAKKINMNKSGKPSKGSKKDKADE